MPWPRSLFVALSFAFCSGGSSGCDAAKPGSAPPDAAPSGSQVGAPGPALRAELEAALHAKGPGYVPRTKHKNPDGSPQYTNRLIRETSPYLLQHAHNPVQWFPWGDEAFALARASGRPVFLSIGYSTCHWCHVMEEESFEDLEIAAFLNENYIAIKVDREERPDLDSIYMTAVQAMTGRGGWPMSTWLTPERQPFFAGTYFPPRDGARGARVGFLSLLRAQAERFQKDPAGVVSDGKKMAAQIQALMAPGGSAQMPGEQAILAAVSNANRRYDADNGGARGAPKFPSSFPIRLLLRYSRRSGDPTALNQAQTTLVKMAAGGIYDHVAGGFHRYATDQRWLVPHFEKMLYDNALLATAYLEGYQATADPDLARVARETLDYVLREMTAPSGCFYSATDADSLGPSGEREEGRFFTWAPDELQGSLGAERARVFSAYYAVTAGGNFEGRTILSTPATKSAVAKALAVSSSELEQALNEGLPLLRAARATRPAPLRDDKVQVSWSSLMTIALTQGAFVLNEPRYGAAAERCADHIVRSMKPAGRLLHSEKDGAPGGSAFLDDYAALAEALLDLFELSGDERWLKEAVGTMKTLQERFSDPVAGGYFLTPNDHETLLAREKPSDDGPLPSGNALALRVELRLAELTSDEVWRTRAETTLRGLARPLGERPWSLEDALLAVDFMTDRPREIAVVLPEQGGDEKPLLDVLRRTFVPNRVLVVAKASALAGPLGDALPWAKDKPTQGNKPTAYVCERGACELPTTDPAVLGKQLQKVNPYGAPRP